MEKIVLGLALVIGLVFCFFGYQLFKAALRLVGMLVGGGLGIAVVVVVKQPQLSAGLLTSGLSDLLTPFLVAFLVGAILGAILAVPLYQALIFAAGAGFGWVFATTGYQTVSGAGADGLNTLFGLVFGLFFGLLALRFQKAMIMISTAFSGSWSVVNAGQSMLAPASRALKPEQLLSLPANSVEYFAAFIVLGITGALIQYRAEHRGRR